MSEFTLMCCGECGIEFQMPEHFRADRQRIGKAWFCPNGHPRVYKETDADKFRRERDLAKQQIAQRDDEIAAINQRLEAEQRKMRRLQKRIHAGVCPCCNRTFVARKV